MPRQVENLDKKVKERTRALSLSNKQLLKEIKERKRYEKELTAALLKVEESDKLKTTFLANMSHEIRTPLNGILGFADLLKRGELDDDKRNKYVSIIQNSGEQLLKIIEDILDISLIESNQLRITEIDFSLNEKMDEINEFFKNFKNTIGKRDILLEYEKGLKNGKDEIFTDPFRVVQVINNLLRNAFKFTMTGKVRFGYLVQNEHIEFFVEDTGIGIEPEIKEKVFERFTQGEETLRRSFGGNGLGLPISKGVVEKLGGKIWIEYSSDKGSKFVFNIPLKKGKVIKGDMLLKHRSS